MPASMALLAPNVNSYRRFQPGMYVPTQASWGHNNRTVALRIPCGDRHNHRVEYRVAGADANPYLVMAAIFAGILHGLDNPLPLQEEVEGNGLEQEGLPFAGRIPYDKSASACVNEGRSLAQTDCPARDALKNIYDTAIKLLFDYQ